MFLFSFFFYYFPFFLFSCRLIFKLVFCANKCLKKMWHRKALLSKREFIGFQSFHEKIFLFFVRLTEKKKKKTESKPQFYFGIKFKDCCILHLGLSVSGLTEQIHLHLLELKVSFSIVCNIVSIADSSCCCFLSWGS